MRQFMTCLSVVAGGAIAAFGAVQTSHAGFVDGSNGGASGSAALYVNMYVNDAMVYDGGGVSALVLATDTPNVYSSYGSAAGSGWSFKWDALFDPDPFVTANIEVTNDSSVSQTFILEFFMPVGIDLASTLYSGSIDGMLIDQNGNGAQASAPTGGSLYSALIDGSVFYTLLDNPHFVVAAPNQLKPISLSQFGGGGEGGVAGPKLEGTEVLGLRFAFVLTPGDTLQLNGNFTVSGNPVPGPAAVLPIIGMALAASGRRRRI